MEWLHKCLINNKILDLKWDKSEDDFIFGFNEIHDMLLKQ